MFANLKCISRNGSRNCKSVKLDINSEQVIFKSLRIKLDTSFAGQLKLHTELLFPIYVTLGLVDWNYDP